MSRGRSALAVLAALAALVMSVACSDVDTAPNVATSIEFDRLPFPAIVVSDTLRDTSGFATPLRAIVYNFENDEILDADVRYIALDPVVTIDAATGYVVAGAVPDTSARIIAFIGGLQSAPLRLSVVRRPDSVARSGTIDTLRYSVIDSTQNLSGELAVIVLHRGATGNSPVRDWIVTFGLQTPADSVRARIVNEAGRASGADTTATTGIASRRIRLLPAGLTTARDSIVVLARVRYRGSHVAGSPLRLVLPVQPRVP